MPSDLVLNELRQRDLQGFAESVASAAAEIDALARTLPGGNVGSLRFLLQQQVLVLTGCAVGIRDGLLVGKDAMQAMERGLSAYNRERWRAA